MNVRRKISLVVAFCFAVIGLVCAYAIHSPWRILFGWLLLCFIVAAVADAFVASIAADQQAEQAARQTSVGGDDAARKDDPE